MKGFKTVWLAPIALASSSMAEIRMNLRQMRFLPGDMGLFGLADMGRVWFDGEGSDGWHHALGGGVWMGFLMQRDPTVTFGLARSEEGTRPYLRAGFAF